MACLMRELNTARRFDYLKFVKTQLRDEDIGAQKLADAILARANQLDHGRPGDDTSILVIRIVAAGSRGGHGAANDRALSNRLV